MCCCPRLETMLPRRSLTSIPPAFTNKKSGILASLAVTDSSYTDASPKGSVDAAIRPLIDRINALDGVVTTSSCAGRVSIFLEGKKGRLSGAGVKGDGNKLQETEAEVEVEDARETEIEGEETGQRQSAVPGGKGRGGRWLFVSHEPIKPSKQGGLAEFLGRATEQCNHTKITSQHTDSMRLIRFLFEPMILHIMTASLHHAQPILAAAINAGFRESGVQSLKNLEDANAFPMVAVRTSGLAFESLIGYLLENETRLDGEHEAMRRLVSDEYLENLLDIANERFKINAERTQRFEEEVFGRNGQQSGWEDPATRRARKKAEGLARQADTRKTQTPGH
ncbi:MAG: hypothetical protein Q9217_000842 [Psora testacea]